MERSHLVGIRTILRLARRGLLFSLAEPIGYPRWLVFTRGGRQLPFIQKDEISTGANDYSQAAFSAYRPLERVRWPLLLLASVPDVEKKSLLVVGPRFESEFLIAEGLGWNRRDIFGLDLLAYSRRVTIGNMHSMPFPDDSFSHVTCGWTISYSLAPERASRELTRVLAPGGYLSVGVEVTDRDRNNGAPSGILTGKDRVQSRDDFIRIFPDMELCAFVSSGSGGNALALLKKSEGS